MDRQQPVSSTLASVLGKLKGVRRAGNGYLALCPCHNDHTPSLSLSQGNDGILLYCHAGCKTEDIMAKLGLSKADLFVENDKGTSKEIERTYDYQDKDNRLLFQVVRYRPKSFAVRRPNGNGWIWDMKGIAPVLYHLPAVLEAVTKQETIYITEGEKDADCLSEVGLIATTAPFGASGKWFPTYTETLKDAREIVILPDNDSPGKKRAQEVAENLRNSAASLRVIELPGLPPGGDVSDWLKDGHNPEELKALVEKTPMCSLTTEGEVSRNSTIQMTQHGSTYHFTWNEEQVTIDVSHIKEQRDGKVSCQILVAAEEADTRPLLRSGFSLTTLRTRQETAKELKKRHDREGINWEQIIESVCSQTLQALDEGGSVVEIWGGLSDKPIARPEYLVAPILPKGKPTLFFGEGKVGKSYLALALALMVRLPYLDNELELTPAKATPLILDYETDQEDMTHRLETLIKGFGLPPVSIPYRRCTMPFVDDIGNIQEIVNDKKVDFIIVDSLGVAASGGNLNDSQTATSFFQALRKLEGVTSLIITHTSKDFGGGTGPKTPFGSVYFTNLARSVFEIKKQQEVGEDALDIALLHRSNNTGRLIPPLGFRMVFDRDSVRLPGLVALQGSSQGQGRLGGESSSPE